MSNRVIEVRGVSVMPCGQVFVVAVGVGPDGQTYQWTGHANAARLHGLVSTASVTLSMLPPSPPTPTGLRRVLRRKQLPECVGLQRSQIDNLIKLGEFPKPFPLSDANHAVGWWADEIEAWQKSREAAR